MTSTRGLARLVRWPGVATAAGDAAAVSLVLLPCAAATTLACAAAAGLVYAGGVVLNDAADAGRDATLHPDRPLPRGEVSRGAAAALGGALLVAGVGAGLAAGRDAGLAYAGVAAAAVAYDLGLKRWGATAILAMAACRGGSVLAAGLGTGLLQDLSANRAVGLLLPWAVHGAAVTAASLLEESPRARALLPLAGAGIVAGPALGAVLAGSSPFGLAGPALLAAVAGLAVAAGRRGDARAAAATLVREGVFGFLLLDAAVLAAAGRLPHAGAFLLAWAALRALLARRRS
jgi:hypothetical protein